MNSVHWLISQLLHLLSAGKGLADNGQVLSPTIVFPRVSHTPVLTFDLYKKTAVFFFQFFMSSFVLLLAHFPDHPGATMQPVGGAPGGAIALFYDAVSSKQARKIIELSCLDTPFIWAILSIQQLFPLFLKGVWQLTS